MSFFKLLAQNTKDEFGTLFDKVRGIYEDISGGNRAVTSGFIGIGYFLFAVISFLWVVGTCVQASIGLFLTMVFSLAWVAVLVIFAIVLMKTLDDWNKEEEQ